MKKLLGISGLLVFICAVTALIEPNFLNAYNLQNTVRWTALFSLIAIGVSFVIITGGIDLSIGSTIGLVGSLLANLLTVKGWSVGAALTTVTVAASLPPASVDTSVATTAVANTTPAPTTIPVTVAAPTTIDAAATPRTLTLTGRMVFSYITFQSNEYPLAKTITLTGPCDGRGPCTITPPFAATPYEGQPASYDLKTSDGGYTLTTRFNHVEPGAACAPISTKLQLTMSIVGGASGRGVVGSGQYVPDRRSTPLPDGSKGCTTDVGVFTFASQGSTPPALPAPAPPPPG